MIADLKIYAIITLLLGVGVAQWQKHVVTEEFREYKENINAQVQKAAIAKAVTEAAQNAKYTAARTDLNNTRRDLDSILGRLRDGALVSRDEGVCLAGSGGSTVPGKAADTGGTSIALATREGTCESSFYADALRTTLQCKKLIKFLTSAPAL